MNKNPIISRHFVYVGKGWYRAKYAYTTIMEAIHAQEMEHKRRIKIRAQRLKIGTLSPVKYNGSFMDMIPQ
jgi:hypothetical protein